MTSARYSPRAAAPPKRTAMVRLPATRPVSRSRMLFTTRIAVMRAPTGTEASHAEGGTRPACTQADPQTATKPKNANTKTSPSPLYPSGNGPAV